MEPVVEACNAAFHRVTLAATLDGPGRSRVAVILELASTGARLLSAGRFQPGEPVGLWLLPADSQEMIHATGKVAAADPSSPSWLWRCRLELQFDAPLPDDTLELLVGRT